MNVFYFFEILGTIVFAISGANRAADQKMDWFGAVVLATVTAIGGGSLRDMLLGIMPVSWTRDLYLMASIALGVILAYLFKKKIETHNLFLLIDAIGLALFTIVGIEKALQVHTYSVVSLFMGVITACFGGIIRDVLCGEAPVVLQKEIYATAALLGGMLYIFFIPLLPVNWNVVLTCGAIVLVRWLAVRYKWQLPRF